MPYIHMRGKGMASDTRAPEKGDEPPRNVPFYKVYRDLSGGRQEPRSARLTSAQVAQNLAGCGVGWDKEIENMLQIPEGLFGSSGETSLEYSKSTGTTIALLPEELSNGRAYVGKAEYNILIYAKASSEYFVFVDAKRRIIVREKLSSLTAPEREGWKDVKQALKEALDLAKSRDAEEKGLFAVFDGFARLEAPVMAH